MSGLSEHDRAVLSCIFNPNLPLTDAYDEVLSEDIKDVEDEENANVLRSKSLELRAVREAEAGRLVDALNLLNEAITISPDRAALYNNRAQVLQLNGEFQRAFEDVTSAVRFAKSDQKRTLCQALCQRGLLHRKAGRTESAKEDFESASILGSQFAKSQLVDLNPYAALCNQMLQKVMTDLQ